jgi:hypothetical protein
MNQTMLYKAGGSFEYEGNFYTYIIVDDCNLDNYLNDGWFLTTTEASENLKDQEVKKRGRPPKVDKE